MTKEQQRIAIAEWMGIKPTTECPDCFGTGYGGSECDHNPCDTCKTTGKVKSYVVSPDYPNDLNSIHEAENKLDHQQHASFSKQLRAVFCRAVGCEWDDGGDASISSGPEQRSEALCRTLWPERFETMRDKP